MLLIGTPHKPATNMGLWSCLHLDGFDELLASVICSIQEMGDLRSTTRCLLLLKLGFNLLPISFFFENLSDIRSYSKYQMYEDWKILRSAWADSINLPVVWYDAQSLCLTRLFSWLSESLIININFHSHTHLFLSVHYVWLMWMWMNVTWLSWVAGIFVCSIWSVDLAFSLQKFSVRFSYFTITVGANPKFSVETFYKVTHSPKLVFRFWGSFVGGLRIWVLTCVFKN